MAKERSSNFELLRIVSMFMIVLYHFAFHSHFSFDSYSFNAAYINFLEIFGKVGVDVFLLISGYFLVDAKQVRISKIIKLWTQIFFYSITVFLVSISLHVTELSNWTLYKAMLPISSEKWWFASAYFIMYLFSPFLNRLLRTLSQKSYISMLAMALILWSLISVGILMEIELNDLILYCMIYSIGGYIRLYADDEILNKKKLFFAIIIIVAVSFGLQVLIECRTEYRFFNSFIRGYKWILLEAKSPFTIAISILLFLLFKGIKLRTSKFINVMSSATFGVYLIHDNEYTQLDLWKNFLRTRDYQNFPYFIIYSIAICLAIYIVCTLIELARIYILEKNYMKLVYKAEPKINKAINKIMNPIYNKLQ